MPYLLIVFCVLAGLLLWRRAARWVWLSSLVVSLSIAGCGGSTPPPEARRIPSEQVREICWRPTELDPKAQYFIFPSDGGMAVSELKWDEFHSGIRRGGFIYKFQKNAPVNHLGLLPLSRPEAWCTNIPKPTDDKVLQLLEVCPAPPSMEEASRYKALLGQTAVSIRSPLFCDKQPRTPPTPQEIILIRAKNAAYQSAYRQARTIAMALTQAEADMQRVTSESKWSLKHWLLEDPGTLEQIQLRVANALNSIEPPPEYDDPILAGLSLAGFHAGFDDGKFAVEAKLFAIDAGILILEVVATEVVLGPLGGVKLVASALSKGSRAMRAAFVRLGDIPIFIPGAAGGVGGFVRARHVLKALSRYHARRLEAAMFAEAKLLGKPLVKRATDETHHIVAQGSDKAKNARGILAKFGIDIDHPANGVFLPANKKSPNPKGSIVHRILGNNKAYYDKVEDFLKKATSQTDALRRLRRIGETLENGTFFNVNL